MLLMKLNSKINIKIGDHDDTRSAVVEDTLGQGTGAAAKGISLTIGKCFDSAIPESNHDSIGEVKVDPKTFVDQQEYRCCS